MAKEFTEHTIAINGGTTARAVRAISMTCNFNTVAGLYARLNIVQSHSRLHVSDDNPFSEEPDVCAA